MKLVYSDEFRKKLHEVFPYESGLHHMAATNDFRVGQFLNITLYKASNEGWSSEDQAELKELCDEWAEFRDKAVA